MWNSIVSVPDRCFFVYFLNFSWSIYILLKFIQILPASDFDSDSNS